MYVCKSFMPSLHCFFSVFFSLALFHPYSLRVFGSFHQYLQVELQDRVTLSQVFSRLRWGWPGPFSAIHRAPQRAGTSSGALLSLDFGNALWNRYILDPSPFTTFHLLSPCCRHRSTHTEGKQKLLSSVVQAGPPSNSTTKGDIDFTCPGYTHCATHY
jgi:hypothetical protein